MTDYKANLEQHILALDNATLANYALAVQNAALAAIAFDTNVATVLRPTLSHPVNQGGLWRNPDRREALWKAFQAAKRFVPQPPQPTVYVPPPLLPQQSFPPQPIQPSLWIPLPPGQARFDADLPWPDRHATAEEEKDFYQGEQTSDETTFALNELGLEEETGESSSSDDEKGNEQQSQPLTIAELQAEQKRCQVIVERYASMNPTTLTEDQLDEFEECQNNLEQIPLLLQMRQLTSGIKKEEEKRAQGGFGHWSNTITIINRLIDSKESARVNALTFNNDAKRILADEEKKRPNEYQTFWEPIVDWFNEDLRKSRYQLYRAIVEYFETNGCQPLNNMPLLTSDGDQWKVEGYWWNVNHPNASASLPFVVPRQKPWRGMDLFLQRLLVVENNATTTRSAPLKPIASDNKCKICGWQDTKDSLDYTITPPSLGEPRFRWTSLVKHYIGVHNYEPSVEFRQLIMNRATFSQAASITPAQLEAITSPSNLPNSDLWYFSPEELKDACL